MQLTLGIGTGQQRRATLGPGNPRRFPWDVRHSLTQVTGDKHGCSTTPCAGFTGRVQLWEEAGRHWAGQGPARGSLKGGWSQYPRYLPVSRCASCCSLAPSSALTVGSSLYKLLDVESGWTWLLGPTGAPLAAPRQPVVVTVVLTGMPTHHLAQDCSLGFCLRTFCSHLRMLVPQSSG